MWNTIANFLVQLLPFILIFGVFWFLIIRPQQKRDKEHQASLGLLKKDDQIITKGGILGTIEKVDDKVLTLRISRDTKIKVLRTQIEGTQSQLLGAGDDDEEESSKEIEDKSDREEPDASDKKKKTKKKTKKNDDSDVSDDDSDDSTSW